MEGEGDGEGKMEVGRGRGDMKGWEWRAGRDGEMGEGRTEGKRG